ncbi:MAG: C40 family peptidase [Magnetococcales bacterium]|nr:C40 family peptidase [Magnetococcales bacterium]
MINHWVMDYLGAPWSPGADGPDFYDCWGLVRAVYRDRYGVDLPVIPADATSPLEIRRAMTDERHRVGWDAIPYPVDRSVALMSHGKIPHHIGIVVNVGSLQMLHSVEGHGVVLQSMRDLELHGWNIQEFCRLSDARDG